MKSQRTLTLLSDDQVLKTYQVALGSHPVGPKTAKRLRAITLDRRNPKSRFHLSLHVSYPDAADMARARKLGVAPGGDIFVHGLPGGWGWLGSQHRRWDWTDGCIAVTNSEIEEIWRAVPDGTPIEIKP